MFAFPQKIHKDTATYGVFENVVSPEACKQIISLSEHYQKENAKTASNPEKRSSDIYWLQHSPQLHELFQKLSDTVTQANQMWWDFHLAGFLEPLQLTHYRASKGGHYDWHMDRADFGTSQCRKISGSLILNDDYQGGNLEMLDSKPIGKLKPGSLVLFPSYHVHRVTPVTKGERWSLVFWVTGPRFV